METRSFYPKTLQPEMAAERKIQAKLEVGPSQDEYEHEADQVADKVTRMPGNASGDIQLSPKDDREKKVQMKPLKAEGLPGQQVSSEMASNLQSKGGQGTPLPVNTSREMGQKMGGDFSQVRVHTGTDAVQMNKELGASAFTHGNDIYFNTGKYSPEDSSGKRLLAHELTHTMQQRSPTEPRVQKKGNKADEPTPTEQPPPMADWEVKLNEMMSCSEEVTDGKTGKRERKIRNKTFKGKPIEEPTSRCVGLLEHIAQTITLHGVFSEDQLKNIVNKSYSNPELKDFINANKVMGIIALYYAGGDLTVAATLLSSSPADDLTPITIRKNVGENWGYNLAFACIVRSLRNYSALFKEGALTDKMGTRPFDKDPEQPDEKIHYETVFKEFIDELLRIIPKLNLTQDQKNLYFRDILITLRRELLTVTTNDLGIQTVEEIDNPDIVRQYQALISLLSSQITDKQQMKIITDTMEPYTLPDPVPAVPDADFKINGSTVSLTLSNLIPANETECVRYGVKKAINTVWNAGSTIEFKNAWWPVVFQIKTGTEIKKIRYELVFDNDSNIRVERIGTSELREVGSDFNSLSVEDKKKQLVKDYNLSGIDDRKKLPRQKARDETADKPALPAVAAQAEAKWSSEELNMVKAAFDLMPVNSKSALSGIALVRGHISPAGPLSYGVAHFGDNADYDEPNPPAHKPPHIHYYDSAFNQNDLSFIGQAGNSSPKSNWNIMHEVGHMVMYQQQIAANKDINANKIPGISYRGPEPQLAAFKVWFDLSQKVANDVVAFNNGITSKDAVAGFNPDDLITNINNNQPLRDAARIDANFPASKLNEANTRDKITDALFEATRQLRAGKARNDIFIAIANKLGFYKFTNYASTGDSQEWFAETFALYVNDPNRLLEMNKGMFQWFEAGMPWDSNWEPPK